MEPGLMALLEINLTPKMLLLVAGDYVSRAADLSRFVSLLTPLGHLFLLVYLFLE